MIPNSIHAIKMPKMCDTCRHCYKLYQYGITLCLHGEDTRQRRSDIYAIFTSNDVASQDAIYKTHSVDVVAQVCDEWETTK